VVANADTHRFCFIEKNRLDAFARMAARPSAARTELIAALFGMERFNDFASHFNESMVAALARDSENERALASRRQALACDQQTIAAEQATLMHFSTRKQRSPRTVVQAPSTLTSKRGLALWRHGDDCRRLMQS
jgi:hypothetical protein